VSSSPQDDHYSNSYPRSRKPPANTKYWRFCQRASEGFTRRNWNRFDNTSYHLHAIAFAELWLTEYLFPISRTLGPFLRLPPLEAIAALYLGIWSVTLIHEGGHTVAAILLRWRILEVRVFPFSLKNPDGKWKVEFCRRLFPAGFVLADPKPVRFHSRLRFFAIGGPAANLVTFLVIFITPLPTDSFSSAFLAVIFSWSLIAGLLNLLPIHVRNVELDGYMAFVVSWIPARLAVRLATLRYATMFSQASHWRR